MLKLVLISLLFLFLVSPIFSVSYISPNPEDGAKLAYDNVTFRVYDEGTNINDCVLELNEVNYSMNYSGGFCTYVLGDLDFSVVDYTFRVFYDSGSNVLETRNFQNFPTPEKFAEAPFMSFYSFFILFLFILGGLFFRR